MKVSHWPWQVMLRQLGRKKKWVSLWLKRPLESSREKMAIFWLSGKAKKTYKGLY